MSSAPPRAGVQASAAGTATGERPPRSRRGRGGRGGGGGGGRGGGRGGGTRSASTATVDAPQKPQKRHAPADTPHASDLRFADMPGLSAASKKALTTRLGYEFATEVQKATMGAALEGRDLLARARTGTGKTLGFLLPTIERITGGPYRAGEVRAIVVSPTRELASQIAAEAADILACHAGMGVQVVVGGTNRNGEAKRLASAPCTILVCTPGRFHDHCENTPGFGASLRTVQVAILDECDRLLEMGFRADVERLLKQLPPKSARQTLLYSATTPDELGAVKGLALKSDHVSVDCVGEEAPETAAKAEQASAAVPKDEWLYRLAQVVSEGTLTPNYKIMVFCATARAAGFLAPFFRAAGLPGVMEIHSRMSQPARTRTSTEFRDAEGGVVLFTSDVSARGVDYPGTTLVVQAGMPDSRETYVHRLGRTARAGLAGKGLLLLSGDERRFLRQVQDLPIETAELGPLPAAGEVQWRDAVDTSMAAVRKDKDLHEKAERCYGAWLGYMNGQCKALGWDKTRLVAEAADYSRSLGLREVPALPKRTIGKMGLKGVPGLRIEP